MSNNHVHPIFAAIFDRLMIPKRVTCHHPALQINDEGVCCDCGERVENKEPTK